MQEIDMTKSTQQIVEETKAWVTKKGHTPEEREGFAAWQQLAHPWNKGGDEASGGGAHQTFVLIFDV
jgi:hypothetical protein